MQLRHAATISRADPQATELVGQRRFVQVLVADGGGGEGDGRERGNQIQNMCAVLFIGEKSSRIRQRGVLRGRN